MDELFAFPLWENKMRKALSAIHPSQFLFSVAEPGLSGRIGLLKQSFISMENWLYEDPDIACYEEV